MPPKPKVDIPVGEHVDEVSMVDFESTKGSSSSNHKGGNSRTFRHHFGGGDDDEEEDDDEGPSGGQRVECNTH